jgi:hypothetical protein
MQHLEKTKAKVCTRNCILKKLSNSQWGAKADTIRTTALALCFSATECAFQVWERSVHARKVDPALNTACRQLTGCLKPTNVNSLYLLAGIAPPDIRHAVASRMEHSKQMMDTRHPLYNHSAHPGRLKSRRSFLATVQSLEHSSETT